MSQDPIRTVVSADGRLRAGLVVVEPDALQRTPPPGVSREALAERGLQSLLLDLSRVEELSSTALGWLIRLADNLSQAGGGLILLAVQERPRELIEVLGLGAFLDLAWDPEEALALLAGPPRPPQPPSDRRGPVYGAPPPRRPRT